LVGEKDLGKILHIIINKPGKSQAFLLLCFIATSTDCMSALSEGYSIGRTTCQRHRGQWLGSGGYRGNYQVIWIRAPTASRRHPGFICTFCSSKKYTIFFCFIAFIIALIKSLFLCFIATRGDSCSNY
jgi:hypothetical protein